MQNSTQITHHCLLPYMGGILHAAIQKKVLQQYHCLSVVIYNQSNEYTASHIPPWFECIYVAWESQ